MEIRKAKLQDLEQVTKFGLVLLKQHADLDPYFTPIETVDNVYRKFLEGCLNSENKLLLVAEKEGKLMGYAAAEIQKRSFIFKIAENGYINDVYVEEEFRKLGIARMFLTELKNWFNSRNIEYIELSVLASNEVGKKTWAKFGFEAFEIRERVEMGDFKIT